MKESKIVKINLEELLNDLREINEILTVIIKTSKSKIFQNLKFKTQNSKL
ncbi:MAG: hypothetical protein IH949_07015 [Bacteroidetes bacterium]|nr:hypothetical protein [Bacteroidota bacterium]